MKTIWAPWRIDYILSEKGGSCVFCTSPGEDDGLIITRGDLCFAIMNRFPYTTGHCMVAPYRHVGALDDLSGEELSEMMAMVQRVVSACRAAMHPEGFNIGCNMGTVAGAGIADHLHMHVVPRWKGDTNFMPVIGDVHVISEHIAKTLERIKVKLA